jgi:hypothetical protein
MSRAEAIERLNLIWSTESSETSFNVAVTPEAVEMGITLPAPVQWPDPSLTDLVDSPSVESAFQL